MQIVKPFGVDHSSITSRQTTTLIHLYCTYIILGPTPFHKKMSERVFPSFIALADRKREGLLNYTTQV